MLGTKERVADFLKLAPSFEDEKTQHELLALPTSEARWNKFLSLYKRRKDTGDITKKERNLIEEIVLQLLYPRLDIHVTKGLNHLLKSPFCIHPKTGKVCVPFTVVNVDKFNPSVVPTIE